MKKFRVIAFALIFVLIIGTSCSFACTAVYVGKDVSSDGTTMIARSEDQGCGAYNKLFYVEPRVENQPGRIMEDVNGLSIPLPATTYKFTCVPDYSDGGDGPYHGACTNEYGLSISATVSASPCEAWEAADPYKEPGLREAVLTGIVAETCKTSKQGVEKLAELVKTYGSEEGNIIMLVDQKEAWIMEIYSGTQWAAMKMPTDKVAVFGNQFMIGAVDPADTENYMFSDKLFSMLDALKLTVKEGNKVHLAKSICHNERSDYSNMRTWIGHVLLSPSTVNNTTYTNSNFYDLFYKPDKKISPIEVMDVLRNRYEGTSFDASLPGNEGLRVIGVERQSQIHIMQVYEKNPAEMSAIQWLAFGNAEHSVFVPAFSGITDTHAAYKVDGESYNDNGAYWKFKRICTLAEQNRGLYGDSVKDYWHIQEQLMYKKMQTSEKEMLALYAKNPVEARTYVTKLGKDMAQSTFNQTDKLFADLFTKMMFNTGLAITKTKYPFAADTSLRDAADLYGYTLKWNGASKPMTLSNGSITYSFTVGNEEYTVTKNGTSSIAKFTKAPYVEKGTTYVTVDFVKGLN